MEPKKSGVISNLMLGADRYMSSRAIYILEFQSLQKKGVSFKDIGNHLMNVAKNEGYHDGTDQAIEKAKTLDLAWHHAINLFLGWIDRNWVNYEKKKLNYHATRSGRKAEIEIRRKNGVTSKPLTAERAEKLMKVEANIPLLIKALEGLGYKVSKEA